MDRNIPIGNRPGSLTRRTRRSELCRRKTLMHIERLELHIVKRPNCLRAVIGDSQRRKVDIERGVDRWIPAAHAAK